MNQIARSKLTVLFCLLLNSMGMWSAEKEDVTPVRDNIKPLISTQWNQSYPFNLNAPLLKMGGTGNVQDKHQPVGCGPLGMAQVINYYKYPKMSPDGKYAYEYALSFDKYDEFVAHHRFRYPAKLISDCGVLAFTNYTDRASSSRMIDVVSSFKRLFGYNPYAYFMAKDKMSDEEWEARVYAELKAGRPVLMQGTAPGRGLHRSHLFIIDGYKNGKFHVNLGWGGSEDGYYKLSSPAGYTDNQAAAFQIAPAEKNNPFYVVKCDGPGALTPELIAAHPYLKIEGKLDTLSIRMLHHSEVLALDLSDAEIPYLKRGAFFKTPYLTYVALPKGMTKIPEACFAGCQNLSEVALPAALKTIGAGAFMACTSLLHLNLPAGVEKIGSKAFMYDVNLLHVRLPESTQVVEAQAFENCQRIYRFDYPKTAQLDKEALTKCERLKSKTAY